MKYVVRLLIFAVSVISLPVSCIEYNRIKNMMTEFMNSEIVIPDDINCIYNMEMSKIQKDTLQKLKLVIYYDSLNCSACRISRLLDIYPLYEMSDTSHFSVLTIFSPKQSEIDDVITQLRIMNHKIPIYVDVNKSFSNLNQVIPSDLRFHTFLLNDKGCPKFVGNPLNSVKLKELFIESLYFNY